MTRGQEEQLVGMVISLTEGLEELLLFLGRHHADEWLERAGVIAGELHSRALALGHELDAAWDGEPES